MGNKSGRCGLPLESRIARFDVGGFKNVDSRFPEQQPFGQQGLDS